MITRYYCFAGIYIGITMPEELFYINECRLAPFRTDIMKADWSFVFECVEKLSAPKGSLVYRESGMHYRVGADHSIRYIHTRADDWTKARVRVEFCGNTVNAEVNIDCSQKRIPVKTVLESIAAEHLVARNKGLIFHCSYIDHVGKAILFTAPSETGKSTQADLWHAFRDAEIINGDRAAIRLENNVLLAEGVPFAGSSKYCKNRSLPIEAIVYLSQAPQTTIRKIRGYEAFSKLWEGVCVNNWDKVDMEQVSSIVQKVASEIPVYHLSCTPDESAVIALEEALRKLVSP